MISKITLKTFCALLFLATIQACAYPYLSLLPEASIRPSNKVEHLSTIDVEMRTERAASIGDVIFTITRYTKMLGEKIAVRPPGRLRQFPSSGKWFATHSYNGPDGKGLVVYTNPNYYRGQLGVILDKEGLMATPNPFICVYGPRTGRRYRTPPGYTGRPFFVREEKVNDVWGLRYGGRRGESIQFEVLNQENPKEIEIVQDVLVSEDDFYVGFVVEGVLIKGLSFEKHGINYIVEDINIQN